MLKRIVEFFTGKKQPVDVVAPGGAPYKIEAPAAVSPPADEPPKCGCGRSATGLCVGLHKLSSEAWAEHPNNPGMIRKIVAEPARPAKKAAVKKPTAAKKPAAIKAPAKPRAKKTPQ
jgi:hypothetical protein